MKDIEKLSKEEIGRDFGADVIIFRLGENVHENI